MTIVHFDLAAAQEASNRLDDGIGREGDGALAAQFEGFCQQEQDRFWEAHAAVEDARWLAVQCRFCGPEGSSGPDCGDCPAGEAAGGVA
ncbi:hypothetical protein K1W54_04970 [Micromonospora sp. CPCC 205371]|nr:hypothetical protein [Micromonospora sp. CPCC 205371]